MELKEIKIAVIGLGYVGLPLARLFSTKYKTVGFDMNAARCAALMAGHDATLEVSDELLQDAINNHGFICTGYFYFKSQSQKPQKLFASGRLGCQNQFHNNVPSGKIILHPASKVHGYRRRGQRAWDSGSYSAPDPLPGDFPL